MGSPLKVGKLGIIRSAANLPTPNGESRGRKPRTIKRCVRSQDAATRHLVGTAARHIGRKHTGSGKSVKVKNKQSPVGVIPPGFLYGYRVLME